MKTNLKQWVIERMLHLNRWSDAIIITPKSTILVCLFHTYTAIIHLLWIKDASCWMGPLGKSRGLWCRKYGSLRDVSSLSAWVYSHAKSSVGMFNCFFFCLNIEMRISVPDVLDYSCSLSHHVWVMGFRPGIKTGETLTDCRLWAAYHFKDPLFQTESL